MSKLNQNMDPPFSSSHCYIWIKFCGMLEIAVYSLTATSDTNVIKANWKNKAALLKEVGFFLNRIGWFGKSLQSRRDGTTSAYRRYFQFIASVLGIHSNI